MSLKNGDIIRNVLYGCFAASKNVISKWTDQRKQEYIKTFLNFTNYEKKWSEEKMNEKTKNTLKILTTLGVFFYWNFNMSKKRWRIALAIIKIQMKFP